MGLADYTLWPHQEYGLQRNRENFKSKMGGWVVTGPCGSGKSLQMFKVAVPAAENSKRVWIYTHRIMLTSQLIRNLEDLGADFGVIAASAPKKYYNPSCNLQICSMPTVVSRFDKLPGEVVNPDIVLVDEAHAQSGPQARELLKRHIGHGARVIGYSATPVDLDPEIYKDMVFAGTYADMLECKSHLPCVCYAPDSPDLSQLKPMASGEFSPEDNKRINRVPTIFGRVYDYWKQLNPDALPAVGFAPGVEESKWFVEEFRARGVPCAHIDAQRILMVEKNCDGKLVTNEYESTDELRQEVLAGAEEGRFKIMWNRFVLREAVDFPWAYHCILATSMGSVSTYVQSVGRVLRYFSKYPEVIVQDHGGCIERHGLPNQERNWKIGCTNNSVHSEEMKERKKNPAEDAEPICCPKCSHYRLRGPSCPKCGFMHDKSVRMVRQLDGQLKKVEGRSVAYKAPSTKTPDQKAWDSIYWRLKKSRGTFEQAKGMFIKEMGYPPPNGLPNTPKYADDWGRQVKSVYPSHLHREVKNGLV